MAYKVEFPPDIEEDAESSGGLSLPKNTGKSGKDGNAGGGLITEGEIIAVEICSTILQAHIWFAFDDDFNPDDGQAVFYAHELPFLRGKKPEQLREILKVKLAFGPGSRVRQ